jgi:hypothetical protein
MNQHQPFAAICPLLYRILCAYKGDEKEQFRALVSSAYHGLDDSSIAFAYANLRFALSYMLRTHEIALCDYFDLVDEANLLYNQPCEVC